MFSLKYWANRFFNPRYWPIVGASYLVVSNRYDLEGSGTTKFSIMGTQVNQFDLTGTDTKKLPIRGS